MKILLTIIILFTTLISCAQTTFDERSISKQTIKAVKKIEEVNQLMSSAVGAGGMRPEQWDNFEELKKTATKEELIELTNHPNGVVRSYSFWALSHKKDVDLFSIAKEHINDDEEISTMFGCIISNDKVGDFFIDVLTPEYVDLDSEKMNSAELTELDSLLIYQPNNLSSRYSAINRAKPTENLYPKIRELVIEEKNQSALVTLAKYQKEQDIEIIKNNRSENEKIESGYYHTYVAISKFPRPEFIPLLETNLEKTLDNTHFSNEWRELYKAIASYKNKKAVELLKVPFSKVEHQNIRKYHIRFVYGAIQEFQDPIYNELYWRIWEEEGNISPEIYKYLFNENPSKTYELTKKEMIENYQPQKSDFVPTANGVEFTEGIYETMLNVLITNDVDLANKVIAEQILNSNVHNLPLYTSKVNKQNIFIEPLFERLEEAWNAHIYLDIVKTLIEYDNEEINERILKTRKRNKNLNKDWGGKALDKLLSENGIE
ncbi:MAG: hypothetical protein Wins2KO_13150 [Winogradskyella sp.]